MVRYINLKIQIYILYKFLYGSDNYWKYCCCINFYGGDKSSKYELKLLYKFLYD